MIGTLLGISWTNLRRDRVAQALTFALPVLFFTIFATVFGNQGNNSGTSRIRIAVVDEDQSDFSRRVVDGLEKETALLVRTTADAERKGAPLDRAGATALVKGGDVPVAVVLPKGLGASAVAFGQNAGAPHIQLLADVSDRIAPPMVGGLLQKVAMTSAPDILMKSGIGQFERYAGALTPEQRSAVNAWLPQLRSSAASSSSAGANGGVMGIGIDTVDVMRQGKTESLISFYAAGVGVMFLLFAVSWRASHDGRIVHRR